MDLTPYTCRGFPGDFDRSMREVPVKGIDREQTQAMVRLCAETESILYGPDFSPQRIRYKTGSRPKLEKIANQLSTPPMQWVRDHVRHPNYADVDLPPDRAMTEEQLIESGLGWCNEQCRVFIALCELMEIPARLCFLFHANGRTGHTAAEIFVSGKWALFDVTYGIDIILPNRAWADARDLQREYRHRAHERYKEPLTEYYRNRKPPFDLARGGDLFESIGITNYLIDGVERANDLLTTLKLKTEATHTLTSVPWPSDRTDFPSARGVANQVMSLFHAPNARLKRYLLLAHDAHGLPASLDLTSTSSLKTASDKPFSNIELITLKQQLDRDATYVYKESEAILTINNESMKLRLGLLPNQHANSKNLEQYSWWQWCRAERLWSGELAEAWRVGGHLVPYTVGAPGQWNRPDLTELGDMLNEFCGDILQGDVYLIAWKSGLVQLAVHFKSAYFHAWPKPVPAFPVVYLTRDADLSPCSLMFEQLPPRIEKIDGATILQPWTDMRFLASKTKDEVLTFLPPNKPDVLPAGICRTFWFNTTLGDAKPQQVARYAVPSSWYRSCNVIETDKSGTAATMAQRNVDLISECTQKGGIDTGRVWRYLRRDIRLNKPQEDGAEWEGNLAQAEFNLAYQRNDDPNDPNTWQLFLHHAYHAADVSVYHGAWMGRLECTAAFTAPLPKFRFGGFLYGYLETGDPYLLELSRSVAGVYMAMEWALQPRSCIGRDSYPISNLMALYDYDPQPLYLDFAKQMIERLLSVQQPDAGFSTQAGAGVLTGVSCRPGVRDIHFGSGILSPIAIVEWATRDKRWPEDLIPRLRRWADLMLSLQKDDGHWYVEGKSNEPYTLTGSGTILTLIRAGQILNDPRCFDAVRRYLDSMNKENKAVLGTHSFLSAQYAHIADAQFERQR